MKLFLTNDNNIKECCRDAFCFNLPTVTSAILADSFVMKVDRLDSRVQLNWLSL